MIAEACRPPADVGIPITHWTVSLLGQQVRALGVAASDATVHRVVRNAPLAPHRQKMWLTSHDDAFRARRDEVLHVYYDTPADEHIVCLDEKTGMQALERRHPDVPMAPGRPIRREVEYRRHGTLCLMGAWDVRRGKLFGFVSERRNGPTFVQLLDHVDACYPMGKGHLVCDNLRDHDTDDVLEWLEEHPRWTLHFTPKHASWLNQIECAFADLTALVLRRGSFASREDLREKIEAYMLWHNLTDRPFRWTYRPTSWAGQPALTSDMRH